jgi:hypothetical protein
MRQNNFVCHLKMSFKESWSTTMQCALLFTLFCYFSQLLPPFSRPHKMTASGPQRNRNVNKRTHWIVVDQDSLKKDINYNMSISLIGINLFN